MILFFIFYVFQTMVEISTNGLNVEVILSSNQTKLMQQILSIVYIRENYILYNLNEKLLKCYDADDNVFADACAEQVIYFDFWPSHKMYFSPDFNCTDLTTWRAPNIHCVTFTSSKALAHKIISSLILVRIWKPKIGNILTYYDFYRPEILPLASTAMSKFTCQ